MSLIVVKLQAQWKVQFLLVVFILTLIKSEAQSGDNNRIFYLGAGTGYNNFCGVVGISCNVRVHNKLQVRGGLGIGGWGDKYSLGLKYNKDQGKGWSYCLSYDHSIGIPNEKVKLQLTSGAKKDVTINCLKANTIDLTTLHSWRIGSNFFYLEFGYGIPLQTSPWEVMDGSLLSGNSTSALDRSSPGGIIIGAGFVFGIF
jgi:hypothetical protein